MRLICPNCSTEYDVPDDMIPQSGRTVQCEECQHQWHQTALPPVKRPALDPYVAAVLRAEATREAAARSGSTYEEDSTEDEAPPALEALAVPAKDAPPDFRPAAEVLSQIEAHRAAAKDQLDEKSAPEAIAPHPNPAQTEDAIAVDTDGAAQTALHARVMLERRAFSAGFSFVLVMAFLAGLAYANAPLISAKSPSLAPVLNQYVTRIDMARARLDKMALTLLEDSAL